MVGGVWKKRNYLKIGYSKKSGSNDCRYIVQLA